MAPYGSSICKFFISGVMSIGVSSGIYLKGGAGAVSEDGINPQNGARKHPAFARITAQEEAQAKQAHLDAKATFADANRQVQQAITPTAQLTRNAHNDNAARSLYSPSQPPRPAHLSRPRQQRLVAGEEHS